jgi:hypothetical protein
MSTRSKHTIGALSLGVLALLAVGAAVARATPSAPAVRVPVAGYRLHATLSPIGSAVGSGRFDAVLVRRGPGSTAPSGSPPVPAPRVTCPPDPRMGIPCRIGPGGPFPPTPIAPIGVHWMLVWRLALTGVTGPASASVHIGTQGTAGPLLNVLCSNCQTLERGHLIVTADRAELLLNGHGYVDVQAARGGLSGHIVTVGHFVTMPHARK